MSGCEWIVEAHGCDAAALADLPRLRQFLERLIAGMDLHLVAETIWHQFPVTGGVTGLSLLAESHITVHSFPEYGCLCLNVFCCRPRPVWDFETALREEFGAATVQIRRLERRFDVVQPQA